MKKSILVWVHGPLGLRYWIFSEFSLQHPSFSANLYFRISTWTFAHRKTSTKLASIKNFRTFEQSLSEIWIFQKMHVLYTIYGKAPISWEIHISERLCSKVLKLFMEASLVEVYLWAQFQVKIRKYKFAGELGSCRENSLKVQYLSPRSPCTQTKTDFFTAH